MSFDDSSRPTTPETPLTNSYYHATSTIDDLTAAMANFSRVPSPDPATSVSCCCGKEDCDNLKAWLDLKSRLGSRLVLSAEVGQALLQRHAAYVRQNESKLQTDDELYSSKERLQLNNDDLHNEIDALAKEKAQLEKRLNQALVNNEVTEVSNKTILQELQEAREMISRLTAHHARSVGWDTRLSAALKERDDMQQERDGETHRARLAESRFAALKEKTAKLQTEVRRLQESLEEKRHSRLELSESILQDAKTRLDSFRNSQLGLTAKAEEDELTAVLESLVQDNETLKRDNAELQHLLGESREDLHVLQEELDEQRANAQRLPRSGANTPNSRHFHSGSISSVKDFPLPFKARQNANMEGRSRRRSAPQSIDIRLDPIPPQGQGPLTPDTARSPHSFAESLGLPEANWSSFGRVSPTRSHVSYEVDQDAENEGDPSEFEKSRGHKPLLLLTRSRATQTDFYSGLMSPSPLPSQLSSVSPHEQQSETSSFSESQSSNVSLILERISALLNRLTQADALTLTNRLKRQHLKGADVGHLSRSTVSNIVAEATSLRSQFRGLLEDEKIVSTCSRKDLRVLFKIVKDMFTEMGNMRMTLNEVVLDPSSAPRVSELALNPGKAEAEKREREKERETAAQGGVTAWMAPISKLFSPTGRTETGTISRSGFNNTRPTAKESVRPPRFVPKLGPALAASATTVNVEFSGSGVGRAVTSTFSAPQTLPVVSESSMDISTSASVSQGASSGLMDIFAGAPRNIVEPADPWVVVPNTSTPTLRKSNSFYKSPAPPPLNSRDLSASTATIGRSSGRNLKSANRLSRNVDAVIDVERPPDIDEEADFLPPLLQRTLRRRGLSDSSIHSTFTTHGDDNTNTNIQTPHSPPSPQRPVFSGSGTPSSRLPAWPDRSSMFQVLSRTVQNLRASTTSGLSSTPPWTLTQPFSSTPTSGGGAGPGPETSAVTSPSSSGTADTNPNRSEHNATGSVPSLPSALTSDSPSQPSTPRKIIGQGGKAQPSSSSASPTKSGGGGSGSGNHNILPSLTSWAAATNVVFDQVSNVDPFIASSLRDESYMQRIPRGRSDLSESHARDFY